MRVVALGSGMLALLVTAAVSAQSAAPSADRGDGLEKLRETPRSADVVPQAVEDPGSTIAPSDETRRRERRVPEVLHTQQRAEETAPARENRGATNVAVVSRAELDTLVNRLRGCRSEVAASRGVVPRKVAADTVTVRFVVLPDGTVENSEAVAEKRTDGDVLSCVKRRASETRFAPPVSGRVSVKRRLVF